MKSTFLVLAISCLASSMAKAELSGAFPQSNYLQCSLRGNPGGINIWVSGNRASCYIQGQSQTVVFSRKGIQKGRCLGFRFSVDCR